MQSSVKHAEQHESQVQWCVHTAEFASEG